jgi:hypothetical protein
MFVAETLQRVKTLQQANHMNESKNKIKHMNKQTASVV